MSDTWFQKGQIVYVHGSTRPWTVVVPGEERVTIAREFEPPRPNRAIIRTVNTVRLRREP